MVETGVKACAVIVAAGTGSRLGGDAKQFRQLGDRPLLAWSCALFASHPEVEHLIVVLPRGLAESPPGWLERFHPTVVTGGATRRESVGRGLAAVGDSDFVLIHDAARPFVSADLVSRLLGAVSSRGPVIPVLEVSDAIKQIDAPAAGASVKQTLDRSILRVAQTPQAFPFEQIRRLHELAEVSGQECPDDAMLCEAAGIEVQTIPGERWAFKVTQVEDLALAEWLVSSGRVRPADGT
ncbi:MAG: 2-C-methyl-D-erythritol 4-phosphate cytidylyltransferase [Gemmatimonadales bacterium]|nr:MAG: 2-C-methyl-D-erythritol 4-phosphate cytidylyltransferase [Gemmatimonadales bacterium]